MNKTIILLCSFILTLSLMGYIIIQEFSEENTELVGGDSYKLQKEEGIVYSEKQLLIGNTGNPMFTDEEYLIIMRSNK